MFCELKTHVQILKVWLKFVLTLLKCGIFFLGIVFIGTPYTYKLISHHNHPNLSICIISSLSNLLTHSSSHQHHLHCE